VGSKGVKGVPPIVNDWSEESLWHRMMKGEERSMGEPKAEGEKVEFANAGVLVNAAAALGGATDWGRIGVRASSFLV